MVDKKLEKNNERCLKYGRKNLHHPTTYIEMALLSEMNRHKTLSPVIHLSGGNLRYYWSAKTFKCELSTNTEVDNNCYIPNQPG